MLEKDPLANFHSLATNPWILKIANISGLSILPQHAHEIAIFCAFYFVLNFLASLITPLFYPQYKQLSPRARHGFDMHVVSQFNAVAMCALSFPLFFSSASLPTLTSYTPYAGLVVAHNVGYFLWDVFVVVFNYKYEGFSYLAHAATALYVFTQALRPFMFNYAAPFIWFEASTPFVNLNWFAVHIPGLISERLKLINGLILMLVFFLCRIVSGPYHGFYLFREVFTSNLETVPNHVVFGVITCYVVLVGLNFVWFAKMVKILIKTLKKKRE